MVSEYRRDPVGRHGKWSDLNALIIFGLLMSSCSVLSGRLVPRWKLS